MPDLSTMRTWQMVLVKQARPFEPEPAELTAHLQFLDQLLADRKAVILGPFAPGGPPEYIGALVLDAATAADARRILADEPFVKAGYTRPEIHPWFGPKAGFGPPASGVKDLVGCRLGLFRRPDNAPAATPAELQAIQKGHLANIMNMLASGELAAAGPFTDDGALRGVLVFRIEDDQRIRELVARDPAIKAGRLVLDLYPWRVPTGTLPPARASAPAKK